MQGKQISTIHQILHGEGIPEEVSVQPPNTARPLQAVQDRGERSPIHRHTAHRKEELVILG